MTRFEATDDSDGGVVVERDAELRPLPDGERVPDEVQQPPVANDTIQPDALDSLALVPDASAEGKEAKVSRRPVASRLPLPALVGLAVLVGVAGVLGAGWSLRRRRQMRSQGRDA